MTDNWMVCSAKFTKQLENGTFRRVTEKHLFQAMSFTDAEARVFEELGSIIRGEFVVTGIQRKNFHEVLQGDGHDFQYECKAQYMSQDADSDKPKAIKHVFLVSANSPEEATTILKGELDKWAVDFEITGINKSQIIDVFPFTETLDKEISRKPISEAVEETATEEQSN